MARWTNTYTLGMPSGAATNTIVVDPTTSGTVLAGTRVAPSAGNLLVCIAGGGLTQTTPSGWTLPTNGSAVGNGGTYIWSRTATGSDTITTTVNGPGTWPTVYTFLEFAAGSTLLGANSAINVSKSAGAGPTLTTAAGTKLYVAVGNQNYAPTSGTPAWSAWGNSAVEFVDVFVVGGSNFKGYVFGHAYIEDSTATSMAVAATLTSNDTDTTERLMFAVQVTVAVAANPLPDLHMAPRR
jgi:hypothetical protein